MSVSALNLLPLADRAGGHDAHRYSAGVQASQPSVARNTVKKAAKAPGASMGAQHASMPARVTDVKREIAVPPQRVATYQPFSHVPQATVQRYLEQRGFLAGDDHTSTTSSLRAHSTWREKRGSKASQSAESLRVVSGKHSSSVSSVTSSSRPSSKVVSSSAGRDSCECNGPPASKQDAGSSATACTLRPATLGFCG